jgi:hypothetical protein
MSVPVFFIGLLVEEGSQNQSQRSKLIVSWKKWTQFPPRSNRHKPQLLNHQMALHEQHGYFSVLLYLLFWLFM